IQRCESMMGLFFLTGLYCAIRSWEARGLHFYGSFSAPSDSSDRPHFFSHLATITWWDVLAMLCCALAAGCKEVVAGGPLLLMLYDWCFPRASVWQTFRRRWLLYVGVAIATWGVLGAERLL